MIDDVSYNLKTMEDFSGDISNIIKITRTCEKAGLDSRNMINILRRTDKEKVLKEINEFMYRKTEQRIKQEEVEAQKQRANDFGIGA